MNEALGALAAKSCSMATSLARIGMQTLATSLKNQNRTLRQLKRMGLVAIYDVRNEGQMLYGYELIRIKIAPEQEKFGKVYPERELYPSSARESTDWGTIAWSFGRNQKKQALAMFNGLVKKQRGMAVGTLEGA